MSCKFIFITGGVISSLGKGLTSATIALLLERQGFKVGMLKLDPYLNVDPGTMNPFEHGEVYVTDDGVETDLDLGHYYRFTSSTLSRSSIATAGQIYETVLKKERKGDYLGSTVQVIPHITNEIKNKILLCSKDHNVDIVMIEIGGTVGDIESLPFLEAIRQFSYENADNCLKIHMTYVPFLKASGELKTKPSQHSTQLLRNIGIVPDIIICRSEQALSKEIKDKISLFCNVPKNSVFDEPDVKTSIYELPILLNKQKIADFIHNKLSLSSKKNIDLSDWKILIKKIKTPKCTIKVGVVGKYLKQQDAYKSVFEALKHAGIFCDTNILIEGIEADSNNVSTLIRNCDGCLVPGGFGSRGWEGKIEAACYCRENRIPFFGICLGLQVMVVEFAKNVLLLKNANSTEIDPDTLDPIVCILDSQLNLTNKGGSMRLGAYPCSLKANTKAKSSYKKEIISERHRHRYEINNKYVKKLENKGFIVSGKLHKGELCEIMELIDHPWMVGVQFHPEFKSKPTVPHPLFVSFIQSMVKTL